MASLTASVIRRRRELLAAAVVTLVISATACGSESTSSGPSSTAASGAATSGPSTAEVTKEFESGLVQRLDAAIDTAVSTAAIPGAIVGIWGPDGRYIRTVGVSDKASGAPMESDFYSRIGSVTKTFTVTSVLQLADQGKVALDDPIAKYIDGVPSGDQITLRQLARMQSGLYNYSATQAFQAALFADPQRQFTPQELLAYAFAEPNEFAPGADFQYCNTNTILLGLVVEKVSGQTLPDYIHDHIVTPLGMGDTSFPTNNAFPEPHAQGYTVQTADGKEAAATDWNPSWGWAAGAMISTLDDLRIWAPVLATGKLLTPEMQAQRLQTAPAPGKPAQEGYGLGIFNLGGWIGHNGSLPGYQTVVVYLPERQLTLVIMINTDIEFEGKAPSATLATAITQVLTPDHVYSLGTPTTEPPR